MSPLLIFLSRLSGLITWPFLREISGIENVPMEGGCLIVANHLSVLDGLILACNLNNRRRHARFVSFKHLYDKPIVGQIMRVNDGIVLDDEDPEGAARTMEVCKRDLRAGLAVALFPEAETRPYGDMGKAKPGAALMALECNVPVVPVGIIGTERVIPRKGAHPGVRWNAVSINIGKPIDMGTYVPLYTAARRRGRLDIVRAVTTIVMREVAALSGQTYPHGARSLARLEGACAGTQQSD